jgi:hypothetical protein
MPRVGHSLHENFQSLAIEFVRENADAGDIAAGTGQRAHQTLADHIARQADDGNRPGRFLCGAHRGITDAKDNVRGGFGECRRDFRKLIIAKLKAAGNDLQVLPLNEAGQLGLVKKRHHPWRLTSSASYHTESIDASGLLRSRHRHPKQRHCRRTSDKRDELAPSHGLPPYGAVETLPQSWNENRASHHSNRPLMSEMGQELPRRQHSPRDRFFSVRDAGDRGQLY